MFAAIALMRKPTPSSFKERGEQKIIIWEKDVLCAPERGTLCVVEASKLTNEAFCHNNAKFQM